MRDLCLIIKVFVMRNVLNIFQSLLQKAFKRIYCVLLSLWARVCVCFIATTFSRMCLFSSDIELIRSRFFYTYT